MNRMMTGSVVWFRPDAGRGMVVSDAGGRFFFVGADALEPVAGLRVSFTLEAPETGGPALATELALDGGRRTVIDPASLRPPPKKKKPAARKKATGSAGKRARVKPQAPPKPRGAMAEGTPVQHPEFGAGHVVMATKTLLRVEFLSGEERSLPVSEVEYVGGKRGVPAPTRKRKAPAPDAARKKTPGPKLRRRDDSD